MTAKASSEKFRPGPPHRAMRQILSAYAALERGHRQIEKLGLSISEFDFIAALGNTDGLRMNEIQRQMITSAANVTRVAKALEGRGLVERRRAPNSDREVLCRLTPAGDALFAETFGRVGRYSASAISGALGSAELSTLATLLEKFTANLRFGDL